MSISLMINNAVSALQTNQAALGVTANNIANVNTPDYARREVYLGTREAGDLLSGVEISEVRRIVNEFLSLEVLKTTAGSDYYQTKQAYHERLQGMIGKPDDGNSIAGRLTSLIAQFNEASVDPTSLPRRADLIADLQQLSNVISGLAGDIQQLRSDADQQFREKITSVNHLTKEIYDINSKIQSSMLSGSDPSALADRRDSALRELGSLLDITVSYEESGRLNVSTTSGLSLVGAVRYELQYDSSGIATPQTVFPRVTIHRVSPIDDTVNPTGSEFNHHLRSGQLSALVHLRDFEMVEIAKSLGAVASTVIDAINTVHNDNTSLPPANALTGVNTGLLATDNHEFTGKMSFAVVSDTGVLVKRIDVDFDAGNYSVNGAAPVAFAGTTIGDVVAGLNTALGADGTLGFTNGVMSVSAAVGTNGIAFLQDSVTPSARGGRGFSNFFGLNNLMGATSPAHFETGMTTASAHGFTGGPIDIQLVSSEGQLLKEISITPAGVSVADLLTQLNNGATGLGAYGTFGMSADGQMEFTPASGYTNSVLVSNGDGTTRGTTGLSASEFFGLGERFQMQQATGAYVESRIGTDSRYLGLAKLDLGVGVVPGDIVITPSDSRGAVAFNDIQGQTFAIPAAGSIVAMNSTLGEYVSTFLADTGQRAALVRTFASNNVALLQEVESRLADERGVSLDEELSNMMIFQQSYNAAARMITTARELYDTLLSIT